MMLRDAAGVALLEPARAAGVRVEAEQLGATLDAAAWLAERRRELRIGSVPWDILRRAGSRLEEEARAYLTRGRGLEVGR